MACREEELLIDLESGGGGVTGIALDEEGCKAGRKTWSSALSCNGIMTGLSDTESNPSNIALPLGGLELAIDKLSGGEVTREVVAVVPVENKNPAGKKHNGKKSSKPPRPPKGPVLTAYDLKLVKELTELAAKKRARIERIKALRKMKAAKRATSSSSSSSSSMPAMIMTALFFFVLIFQGSFTGNNVRNEVVASPSPAMLKDGLVPFQVLNNALTNDAFFTSSEQPLSSSHHRKEGVDPR